MPAARGAPAFHVGSSAADASDRIIYDKSTGSIFFDADGSGNAAQQWKVAENGRCF